MSKKKSNARGYYNVIVKVNDGMGWRFVRYHNVKTSDSLKLQKFVEFIERKFGRWAYINVFDRVTKIQVSSIMNRAI